MELEQSNILITGIGGLTPRSIAKSLKKNSKYGPYKIIGTDCNNKSISLYSNKYVDVSYKVPPISNQNYWTVINDIVNKEKIDLAIVQPEVEVIGWSKKNKQLPCPAILPPYELAISLHNKVIMSDLLEGTDYIPKTFTTTTNDINYKKFENKINYPCWIRASKGSGGFGSLKINNRQRLNSWLFINPDMQEFTISEYLPGKHIATKLLFHEGKLLKGATVECAEYIMADIAPSGVTGNTSYGRLINYNKAIDVSLNCIEYICNKLDVKPEGVLSVDLKEDKDGNPKITEINIRHMAYTGCLAEVGFNLSEDMVHLTLGNIERIKDKGMFYFDKNYIFLRDVDCMPVVMTEEDLL